MEIFMFLYLLSARFNFDNANADYQNYMNNTFIVPHVDFVRDIDGDGREEEVVMEYECRGNEQYPFACKYYLEVSTGEEIVFPRTWITNDDSIEERAYRDKYGYEVTIPRDFQVDIYDSKINQDEYPDLMIIWVFGIETGQTIAIDIRNRELIGCTELWNFGYSSITFPQEDGTVGLDYIDYRTNDPDFKTRTITQDNFVDCKSYDYWYFPEEKE